MISLYLFSCRNLPQEHSLKQVNQFTYKIKALKLGYTWPQRFYYGEPMFSLSYKKKLRERHNLIATPVIAES